MIKLLNEICNISISYNKLNRKDIKTNPDDIKSKIFLDSIDLMRYTIINENWIFLDAAKKIPLNKILLRIDTGRINAIKADTDFILNENIACLEMKSNQKIDIFFLLGLLNSNFLKERMIDIQALKDISYVPVLVPDLSCDQELKLHEFISTHAEWLQSLHKFVRIAQIDLEKQIINSLLNHFENRIEKLITELYYLNRHSVKEVPVQDNSH